MKLLTYLKIYVNIYVKTEYSKKNTFAKKIGTVLLKIRPRLVSQS